MASLKALRTRIRTVQETEKITTAMMLVSGSKLRKAEINFKKASSFIKGFEMLLKDISTIEKSETLGIKLLQPLRGKAHHLVIVMTSDRGLCGTFNTLIIRDVKNYLKNLEEEGKTFSILLCGRKGRDLLKKNWEKCFLKEEMNFNTEKDPLKKASLMKAYIMNLYRTNMFEACTLFYSQFYSVMSQIPQKETLIPILLNPLKESSSFCTPHELDSSPQEFLPPFLEMYLWTRLAHSLLQSEWSEQGARMMAMDGATRNAKEMTASLQLLYNRSRQATITKELIEIISGSEAL
ncbi:MAG: ATP synthase F1 subunit gamma [Proteobacteria bacterium]|nr:ATP synthase F1 subunit gamma [Pseudomonadota bacterium]